MQFQSESNETEKKDSIWPLLLIAVIVTLIWAASWYFLMNNFGTQEARGQFGDMFGSINSLFSGLAFAGIIYTILIQKRELRLQRETLRLQIVELNNSVKELSGQREVMTLQRFETTFFNMIQLHNTILINLEWKGNSEIRGRMVFDKAVVRIRGELEASRTLIESYNNVCKDFQSDLYAYFLNLTTILKYIDNTETLENKETYIQIVSSQISHSEYIIISILSKYYIEDERELLIKYGLYIDDVMRHFK